MIEPIVISGVSGLNNGPTGKDKVFMCLPFDIRRDLGKHGTRNMDRLTALAISGMANLMPDLAVDRTAPKEHIGIVLGSAQGSMDSIVRFTYESFAHDRPDLVNPALFPNTVMNCAAGQAAIWYRLQGLNATVSCHEMSFLAALDYAHLQLRRGAARTLVTGGVEELTEVNMAGHNLVAGQTSTQRRFSECSVFFTLEREEEARANNRKVLAVIRSIKTGFNPNCETVQPLTEMITEALNESGIVPGQIAVSVVSGTWPLTRELELEAIRQTLGADAAPIITYETHGNCGSGQNALQLQQLLSALKAGQSGLLITQERHGNLAALVLRKGTA